VLAKRPAKAGLFLFALSALLAACTGTPISVPATPVPTAPSVRSVAPALSATFDATPAYPGYPWTRDGRAVKPEELGTIGGPVHCGWGAATLLSIGWPVGTLSTSSAESRQYVRDPRGVVRVILRDRFDGNATLPADARATGYVYRSIGIFLSPTDQDIAIYVVGPSGVERWPRADPMMLCS
jgi:hypothetical protein